MVLKLISLIVALSLFLSFSVSSQEFDLDSPFIRNEVKNMLRQSYRNYKKERKNNKATSATTEFHIGELKTSPCVNCDDILELSRGVTEVLKHMSEQLPAEHQQKIHELMAVDVYTQKVNQLNGEDCHRAKIFDLTDEFLHYDIDQALVLHSKEMQLNHLLSFRLQGKNHRYQTVFLRGQGEQSHHLIRVDFQPEKPPFLTVYQLNTEKNPAVEHALIKDKQFAALPSLSDVDPQPVLSHFNNDPDEQKKLNNNNKEQVPEPNLRFFEYESDRYGLPKKITILEFKNETQLTEKVLLKNEVEISTSEQEMITQITDHKGREYARFILDKDAELKAVVPYDFNALENDWQGEFELDKNGVNSFLNLKHSSRSKTRIGYTSSIGMTTIEHSRLINKKSQLTVRISDGRKNGNTVTLNYRIPL